MEDNFKYIDDYFQKDPNPEEKRAFEERIINDPVFAEDVAFYLSALQVYKDELAEEKKKRFKEIYGQKNGHQPAPAKVFSLQKLWPYVTAAAVVAGLFLGWYFFKPVSSQQLANQYIEQRLDKLPVKMATREDSLQTGLRLYNEEKFPEALKQFENILQTDTSSVSAKKYAGIVSLRLRQYDKALDYFRQLADYPGLYSNPGLFLQALTLLERNQADDEKKAKQLLERVVQNDLEGEETAKEWLKKL